MASDSIKRSVANHIQCLVLDTNWNVIVQPVGNRVNEASKITELQTLISIRTAQGPRHFEVIVKESY